MFSIRTLMLVSNALMAFFFISVLVFLISRDWQAFRSLEGASQATSVVGAMSSATIELSLERSLTQVAANLHEPIAPQIKSMLMDQRRKSNELFESAKTRLQAAKDIGNRVEIAQRLDGYLDRISSLRTRADHLLKLPIEERSASEIVELPQEIKSTVSSLDALLGDIRVLMRFAPVDILATDLVIQRAWMIREYGGRERTLFAIATALKEPISRDNLAYMHENHGKALQAWELINKARTSPLLSEDVRAGIAALDRTYFQGYNALRNQVLDASATGDYPVDFQTLFAESEAALQTAIKLLELAVASNQQKVHDALSSARTALTIEIAAVIFFLGLIGVTVWFSIFWVAGPLSAITLAMTALSRNGDTSVHVSGSKRKDEIGAMARALDIFRERTLQVASLAEEEERRKQQAAQEKAAALEDLARRFESTITEIAEQVDTSAERISDTSSSVHGHITQAKSETGDVNQAAERVSENVQSVATAAEELSLSISDIGRKVSEAAETAKRAVHQASETRSEAEALASNAKEIGTIVKLIQDIAEQTNLLALNATIEAARAGDAGRGFAVVASEVKTLAEQTQRATEQISGQVEGIQAATDRMAKSTDQIGSTIEEIAGVATDVSDAVTQQNEATGKIAHSISITSSDSQRAAETVGSVTELTVTSLSSVEQLMEASRVLKSNSQTLRHRIDDFAQEIRTG